MKAIKNFLLVFPVIVLITNTLWAKPFIGISYGTNQEPPGLIINKVVRDSPAEIAGLEKGDIICSIDGQMVDNSESLSNLLSTKSPGDRIEIDLERCDKIVSLYLILGSRDDYQGIMRKGGREAMCDDIDDLIPSWDNDTLIQRVFAAIDKAKYNKAYENLAISFNKELDIYHGHYTLDALSAIMLQPASCYYVGESIIQNLSLIGGDAANIYAGIPQVLDIEDDFTLEFPRGEGLDFVISAVKQSNRYLDLAFANLDKAELNEIDVIIPFLIDIFTKTVYIDSDPDEDNVDSYHDLIGYTKKINYQNLIKAGINLTALDDPEKLEILKQIQPAEGADSSRDILIDRMVEVGVKDSAGIEIPILARLIVTGTESYTYSEEAAIWIDLGGNDTYLGFCGGTPYTIYDNYKHSFTSGRVGIHIDLGGNDTYIRKTLGSVGSGFCGSGCLIDLYGDDMYIGNRLTIGSAFCGTGLLIDRSGNDYYSSDEATQGFATFGAGLVYDLSGNDFYHSTRYSQGCGVSKAVGMLVDHSGDDRYIACFKIPNGYGNEGTWDGWSQGVGMGFRSLAAGGIGVLYDRNGDDFYEAGNFSQACGYFFGMGILGDCHGDDKYIGNRYVQGGGAHQAAAYFRDRQGDDSYLGREAINQGGAWDITSTWFIDDEGDDSYSGTSLSQGGTSQNAFSVFCDLDGNDRYKSGGRSNGSGGGNDYHPDYDARSMGIFLEFGNDSDDYDSTNGERTNNSFSITDDDDNEKTGDGIFWDM